MGNDQHGPAYPEPKYECPICEGSESRYLTCDYPGCPDGRDHGHPNAYKPRTEVQYSDPPAYKRVGDIEIDTRERPPLSPGVVTLIGLLVAALMFCTFLLGRMHG